MNLVIARDRNNSYFVYDDSVYMIDRSHPVIYKGSYTRCLIVIGGVYLGHTLVQSIEFADKVAEREINHDS